MNREELRERFRIENPEITDRVLSNDDLHNMMNDGNIDICVETRCIKSDDVTSFDSVEDQRGYDLTSYISSFYDIDDFSGGGVYYNYKQLTKVSPSEMNSIKSSWRNFSSGIPRYYYKRNDYLYFDVPCSESSVVIEVFSILLPETFNSDSQTPFNDISYLVPFHVGILKYCQWKAKFKIGKSNEAMVAEKEYTDFLTRMKRFTNYRERSAVILRNGYR